MKPLYIKKNGVVYKISGTGIPSIYPAANVEYDNTVTSELQATDVQGAIDELSTRQGGVQSNWTENDTSDLSYIQNKPENLVQDASYVHTDNNYDATAKGKVDSLGTASTKNVPASGNASTTQVVMGNDTRLTDARSASDVSAWAKASTKPTYTASEVGAIASTLKGAVNGVAELDAAGKVPSSQLPSFVDDVIEVADYDHLPITGESGKIYVTLDTNKTYRWTGSGYAEISESLALGETSSTAYRGDRGKTAYNHATETKLSTATASGLYKVAATAQGHIASLTAVTKEDITGLGIPGSDTIIKNTAYGTCDTAGDVKDKVATLVNATNWSLEVGTIVGIRFTYTNTYTNQLNSRITLNINNTGAKTIRYSDDIWTSSFDKVNPTAYGESDQTIYYMYDGTYWVWVSHSKDNDTLYNFKGNEFRSADGNNAGQEIGFGGNANLMVVNGHYYYNSNGPSTDIGASANDGAIYVQAYDEDNVTQIAQNYETGNLFVRSKVNGSWTEWKKTIANITANNTILSTDKTPFLTRQTLNPTGFSGYVREKLIGASYAWNQLVENGDFSNGTTGWRTSQCSISASSNILTATHSQNTVAGASFYKSFAFINGHKYYFCMIAKQVSANSTNPSKVLNILLSRIGASNYLISNVSLDTWYKVECIAESTVSSTQIIEFSICSRASATGSCQGQAKEVQIVDLTLAFGSTIADYLYSLTNNGGVQKLRDMGFPIDKYTPYGYGLYSVKTSGKKIYRYYSKPTIISSARGSTGTITTNGTRTITDDYILLAPNVYKLYAKTSVNGKQLRVAYHFWANTTVGQNSQTYDSGWLNISESMDLVISSNVIFDMGFSYSDNSNINPSDLEVKLVASETTYSLGNDELRGKFDLVNGEIVASGDVKESNGEITRNRKHVNLGDYTWTYSVENAIFYTAASDAKNSPNNCICAKYTDHGRITAFSQLSDKEVSVSSGLSTNPLIVIKDTVYNDTTTFKTAMNGIYLIYELATPTTEQSTPFADPMSLVGATTEEYIDTRDIPCPVGAERQYMGQSEDIVEIPSSPQSDGKRVLISEVSGGKEQVYWDIPKLYYKEYTVQGDGTKTYGNLLAELDPYYDTLSEDEKTYSKVMMRATSSGNECLTFVGNYWYSRMGVNASGLWLDQIDFQYNKYFKQVSGGSITDYTNTNAGTNVIALRVLTYTRAES